MNCRFIISPTISNDKLNAQKFLPKKSFLNLFFFFQVSEHVYRYEIWRLWSGLVMIRGAGTSGPDKSRHARLEKYDCIRRRLHARASPANSHKGTSYTSIVCMYASQHSRKCSLCGCQEIMAQAHELARSSRTFPFFSLSFNMASIRNCVYNMSMITVNFTIIIKAEALGG